ncbi:MAG: alpha/beta hydrolase [Bacteroidia bacterium]|nr:alpha/beta hydrolase [Bacteroidia bacterium]
MLKYFSYGSGTQTIVLIHGFCENNTCFNQQVLFFKPTHSVITVDLPGFGGSEVQAGVTIDEMALEVALVLKHLGVNKCTLFGHSMGGYVTLAFAELYPQVLKGFGLIHSTALPDNTERIEKRKQSIGFIEKNGKEAYINNFIPGLFAENNKSKLYVQDFINEALTGPQEGITLALKAMMNRPDRIKILEESKIPVFFGIGKNDQLISEDVMLKQASICKQSQVCYLQDSAHMSMVEESDKLNESMAEFLNDIW